MNHLSPGSLCLLLSSCVLPEVNAQKKPTPRTIRVTGRTVPNSPRPLRPRLWWLPPLRLSPPGPSSSRFQRSTRSAKQILQPRRDGFPSDPHPVVEHRGGVNYLYDSPGARPQFNPGANIDLYFLRNRYAFGTGIWYTVKSAGFVHRRPCPMEMLSTRVRRRSTYSIYRFRSR